MLETDDLVAQLMGLVRHAELRAPVLHLVLHASAHNLLVRIPGATVDWNETDGLQIGAAFFGDSAGEERLIDALDALPVSMVEVQCMGRTHHVLEIHQQTILADHPPDRSDEIALGLANVPNCYAFVQELERGTL